MVPDHLFFVLALSLTAPSIQQFPPQVYEVVQYAVVFAVAQTIFRMAMIPVGQTVIFKRPSWSRQVFRAKIERFGTAVFKFFASLSGLLVLYNLLKDQAWLPPYLGGRGSTLHLWQSNFEAQEQDPRVVRFFLCAIGFVLADFCVFLVNERRRPDFAEIALHLVISLSFFVFSFIGNYIRLASLVLLVHLACDTFVYAAKSLVDTRLSGGAFAYVPLLVVHVWLRLFAFSKILESLMVESSAFLPIDKIWVLLASLLSLSLLMQTFWGFVILKIGLLLLSTGQSRDLQANLSAMDFKQKRQSTLQRSV